MKVGSGRGNNFSNNPPPPPLAGHPTPELALEGGFVESLAWSATRFSSGKTLNKRKTLLRVFKIIVMKNGNNSVLPCFCAVVSFQHFNCVCNPLVSFSFLYLSNSDIKTTKRIKFVFTQHVHCHRTLGRASVQKGIS